MARPTRRLDSRPDDDGDGYSDIELLESDPLDSNDQPFMHRMSPGILRSIIDLYPVTTRRNCCCFTNPNIGVGKSLGFLVKDA